MSSAMNPYKGRPGFWNRLSAAIYPITGPAEVGIGIGVTEAPYEPPANPMCPICAAPMAEHDIKRGDASTPTYFTCPRP
ncbi:hypothetical protein [Agromyces lapidis]|uniref:Type IV secretion protein Rhs n=1 Tax=Agromyces lapidis TaxID=279574 RepID=A0ABV5SQR4_9MICO|nr:hypothetical protein [Agromyces lapidis]